MNPTTEQNNASEVAGTAPEASKTKNESVPNYPTNGAGVKGKDDPFPKFPAAPKKERRWCVYRNEYKDGRLTKVPYTVKISAPDMYTLLGAKSNDPATWIDYETACAICDECRSDEQPTPEGKVAGIGIFANGREAFIDLRQVLQKRRTRALGR